MTTFTDDQQRNIQGLGIAGYRKDLQHLIFIRFSDAEGARKLLRWLHPHTANAWEVRRFNEVFSEMRRRRHGNDPPIQATWMGVLLSARGYRALGVDLSPLQVAGAEAFTAGMAQRAGQIGDTRPKDAPNGWVEAFRPEAGVDLLVVIAGDDPDDVSDTFDRLKTQIRRTGCSVVFEERQPRPRAELRRGIEHFGFRDGASQPAIEGYDGTPAAGEPPAVPAGEFVLGYPDLMGTTAAVGPLWADGSFLVFRRLSQDVAAFRRQLTAGVPGSDPELTREQLAAKMVGRWPSGAPLDLHAETDPGPQGVSNAFDFSGDQEGLKCPRWGHIRKSNPRAEQTPDPPTDDPRRHRMIRRGGVYGLPLRPDALDDDGRERGLHFVSVVADPVRQFEFVQARWLNDPNFPSGQPSPDGPYAPPPTGPPDGPDPIAGEHDGLSCTLRQASGQHQFPIISELVAVTAGEYFFLPALDAIGHLAEGMTT